MPIVEQYISRIQRPAGRETVPSNMANIAAAPAEAVARMGGALTEFGSQVLNQISQAEDAMEIATLRGTGGGIENATFNTVATTQDPTIREQVFNKGWQDYNALKSKRPNVQRAFDAEKKLTVVKWQGDFNTINNRLRVQNVQDQFRLNHNRLLEEGKLQEDLQLLSTARATMAITQAEYDYYKTGAPNESVLLRMDKAAQEGNFGTVSTLAEQLKDPSADQLKRKNTILAFAKKDNEKLIDATAQEYWQDLANNKFDELRAKINAPNNNLPVFGDGGKNQWLTILDKSQDAFIKGKPSPIEESDPAIEKMISDKIAFDPTSIKEGREIRAFIGKGKVGGLRLAKAEEYETLWKKSIDENSGMNSPVAKKYLGQLKDAGSDRVFSLDAVQNNITYTKALNKLSNYFVNYKDANKKDPTDIEAQTVYEDLLAGYRRPESPFTDAKVQQTVGELESGGSISIFGTVIQFSKPEDAINHALRNLGPNWQVVAPEATEIIKRKWPEAKIPKVTQKIAPTTIPKTTTLPPLSAKPTLGQKVTLNGMPYEYRPDVDAIHPWKPVIE